MPVEVILPKVDMDMSHGTIAVWHVAEGAAVTKGAALFDIETDKAAMEVEAPASGILGPVRAKPGDRVQVGATVALIYGKDEVIPATAQPPAQSDSAAAAVEVILPKVDMDMSHGTLARWYVAEGEAVTKGAALFDIETDKAAMEVEAPASGILHHVTATAGDKIAVGTVLAYIYPDGVPAGAAPPVSARANPPAPAAPAIPAPAIPAPAPSPVPAPLAAGAGQSVRATPAARAVARAAGVELATLRGTGPRGRIQRDDVLASQTAPAPQPATLPAAWAPQDGPLSITHRKGEGRPLVLLHGFTADSQSWAPLEKALGNTPLIRIDLPGHGKSPRRRIASFAELARMIVDAFDSATAGSDGVHLLGHSLGGALAIALADIRPRRIASLSLIAPAGLGPEIDADALGGIVRASHADSLAPWLRRLTAQPQAISDDYARAAMRLRGDAALRSAQADMAQALFRDGVQCFDLRAAFERLAAPTCVIWGRGDHILPYRHALAARSDAAIHLLEGAGHIPQFECPDRIAHIVARHMRAGL